MPLLRRQPFVKQKPPPNLKPDEEVFYCKLTGEIFRDYEQFFERIILCNSLVWSCNYTGKSGLTYQEALDYEERAKKQLASFPDTLQKPILYLVRFTQRTRLDLVIDDVYTYCKDRYFIGEAVEVTVRGERRPGRVVRVNAPNIGESPQKSPPPKSTPPVLQNGTGTPDKPVTIEDSDDEVICTGVENAPPPAPAPIEQPKLSPTKGEEKMLQDATKYTYTVQEKGKLNSHTVGIKLINRKKGQFAREKLKLYFKQHLDTTPEGVWKVKERLVKKFALNEVQYSTFHTAPVPEFPKSEVKPRGPKKKPIDLEKVAKKLAKAEAKADKLKKKAQAEQLANPKLSAEERAELKKKLKEEERIRKEKRKEELKEQLLKDKERLKEEREKRKEAQREEKRRQRQEQRIELKRTAQEKMQQQKQERLQKLEVKRAAKQIERERVLREIQIERENLRRQRAELKFQKEQLRLEHKEQRQRDRETRQLLQEKEREKRREEKRQREEEMKEWSKPRDDMECEDLKPLPIPKPVQLAVPESLFGDIVMVLEYLHCFSSLFDMHDFAEKLSVESMAQLLAETDVNSGYFDLLKFLLTAIFNLQAEEMQEEELLEEGQAAAQIDDLEKDQEGGFSSEALIRAATIAYQWPQLNFGAPLSKLQLDPFTITEVLRIHLLSSGANVSDSNSKYRYQQRGGYTSMDDAGLELRRTEPGIIRGLTKENVYDMTPAEKLRILVALINQLLTFVISRDTLEENYDNLKTTKTELRHHQATEQRRERDEAQYWYKKRMEERAKEREEEEKRKAEKKKMREDKLKLDELKAKAQAENLNLRTLAKAEKIDYLMDEEKKEAETEKEERAKRETRQKPVEIPPERTSARQKTAKEKQEQEKEIPTENIDWEKVTTADRESWRNRFLAKENDMLEKIAELQHSSAIYPVGRDRTYRRYWVFRSLPGLFIEDNDEHVVDECFEPVEQIQQHSAFNSENLPLLKKEEGTEDKSTSSDKENDQKLVNGKGSEKASPGAAVDLNKSEEKVEVDEKPPVQLTQSVHEQIAQRNTVSWAFLHTSQQFELLLNSLNPRGFREGPLKTALLEQRDRILSSISNCPVDDLQLTEPSTASKQSVKSQSLKSRNRVTHGAVNNASAKEFLELNLRESLLDLEERVYAGALGQIKVKDRERWVEAVERGHYEQQAERLEWGKDCSSDKPNVTDRAVWRDAIENGGFDVQDENLMWSGKHIKTEMEKLEEDSDEEDMTEGDKKIPVIRDLKRALLQIEQGIDPKYLNPPLGEDEKTKIARQKAALEQTFKSGVDSKKKKDKKEKDNKEQKDNKEGKDTDSSSESDNEGEENEAMKKTPLERWEESLMSSTSIPQIFLHISVLERSISWTKSALHARCRICRRKGDAEKMLLCDGCDRGHHMYCLKPQVKKIPDGDWYCVDCRPKIIVQTPRKARRSLSARSAPEEDEEEEEQESESEVEEQEDEEQEEESEEDEEGEEVNDSDDNDSDDDDDSDSDDDSDDNSDEEDDDETEEEEEQEEEEEPQPVAVKLIKGRGKTRGGSAPSSGRSTPTPGGRRSKEPTPADTGRTSRSRASIETSGGPAAKRSRTSVEKPVKGRLSDVGSGKGGASKKAESEPKAKGGRHSRTNSAKGRGETTTRTSKRKLDLNDEDDYSEPEAKKVVSKSRGGEEASQLALCEKLLHELSEHKDAWPFIRPVTRKEAPDYFAIIKTPMDFQTMKAKVNKYEYLEPCAMLEDMRIIFTNCERYNVPDAPEYQAGQRLCHHFVQRVRELKLDTLLTKNAEQTSPSGGSGRAKGGKSSSPKVNGGGGGGGSRSASPATASGSSRRRSGRRN